MRLEQKIQLPEDCLKGMVRVTLQGQEKLRIENFKAILSYNPEKIEVLTRKSNLKITGKRLEILSFQKDEMEICGWIEKIEYDQG